MYGQVTEDIIEPIQTPLKPLQVGKIKGTLNVVST